MRQQLDRYFELLPLLVIIIILVSGEFRQQRQYSIERANFNFDSPRLILR